MKEQEDCLISVVCYHRHTCNVSAFSFGEEFVVEFGRQENEHGTFYVPCGVVVSECVGCACVCAGFRTRCFVGGRKNESQVK